MIKNDNKNIYMNNQSRSKKKNFLITEDNVDNFKANFDFLKHKNNTVKNFIEESNISSSKIDGEISYSVGTSDNKNNTHSRNDTHSNTTLQPVSNISSEYRGGLNKSLNLSTNLIPNKSNNKNGKMNINFNFGIQDNFDSTSNRSFYSLARVNSLFDVNKRKHLKTIFKSAKQKILKNQNRFVNKLMLSIQQNNINKVEELMLTEDNKNLFKRKLEKSIFLEKMLVEGKTEMLIMVLQDPFYKFDLNFPFNYLAKKLQLRKKMINEIEEITQFILNIVTFELYPKELTLVLGWFIICFGMKESFISFVKENTDYYFEEMERYNNFESDLNIKEYIESQDEITKILSLCLENNLEDLAIELVYYKGKIDNYDVINTALRTNSKNFLKYIWETSNIAQMEMRKIKHKNFLRRVSMSSPINHITSSYNDNNVYIYTRKNRHNTSNSKDFDDTHSVNNHARKDLFNGGHKVFMISEIISKIYALKNNDFINEIVSTWKFLNNDKRLLDALFEHFEFDEISILLDRYPKNPYWRFKQKNFRIIIETHGLVLILLCLKDEECKKVLREPEIQKTIVNEYFNRGDMMYYGAEMLSHINKTYFDPNLIEVLIHNIINAIKNKLIVDCHSPILTCLLLCEILNEVSEISVHFNTICHKAKDLLMDLCKNINESNPNEKYIKFLLGQKDSKGRSAYEIAANIEAYPVLECPEVGTIVNKMWLGRLQYEYKFEYSSIIKFLRNPIAYGSNPFHSFDNIDIEKAYFHQLALWKESCSLRFYMESLSTILLIILYNLFIFYLVNNDDIMTKSKNLSSGMKAMLSCYILWTCCISLNILLNFFYCFLSKKRKFSFDIWNSCEIALMISAFLILVDTETLFGKKDEYGNIIPSDGNSDLPFIVRATILSINDIFVWLRITGILATYNELGPLLRTIYLLSLLTAKYLLIYLIIMIACATVFTTIFYKASPMYESYSITFTTLFQGYLNNSKVFRFDYYQIFGAIACIAFVTIGGLILVNMLIALLNNEYTHLVKLVDAAHRSVLFTYYKKYKWNKKFGYLILLTTPLNIINFIILPLNALIVKLYLYKNEKANRKKKGENSSGSLGDNNLSDSKNNGSNSSKLLPELNTLKEKSSFLYSYSIGTPLDQSRTEELKESTNQNWHNYPDEKQEKFNDLVSSIYFCIFYFPIIFLIQATISLLMIPIGYIVGFFVIPMDSIGTENLTTLQKFFRFLLWLLFGIFHLLYVFIKDMYYMCKTIFIKFDVNALEYEKTRLNTFINKEDINIFLQFIHKREKTDQNDLHTLFLNFLVFEGIKLEEKSKVFKAQNDYMNKVYKGTQSKNKKDAKIDLTKISENIKNTEVVSGYDGGEKVIETYLKYFRSRNSKRNLIIIEILENFLMDEDSDNFIVDVEKMKMLLPKTNNIDNAYIKRLIYTKISSLKKAVNKKKNDTNTFFDNKLLNKIVGGIARLDKVIEGEGNIDHLKNEEEKIKNNFELDDNEDDFYAVFEKLLQKMEDDLRQNINLTEFQLKEDEIGTTKNIQQIHNNIVKTANTYKNEKSNKEEVDISNDSDGINSF